MNRRVTLAATPSDGYSRGSSNSGYRALRVKMEQLGFAEFQRCVWLWLGASGYQHMLFLGRHHRRGRRAFSGPDFLVRIGADSSFAVAVQVRHWKSPVSRRAVDELRGYLLRYNIPAGMIVSSSLCSQAARDAASEFQGRPIRLVGVDRLTSSMLAMDLGVRDWPLDQTIDEAFFRTLGAVSLGPGRRVPAAPITRQPSFPVNLPDAPTEARWPIGWQSIGIAVCAIGILLWVLFAGWL